MWIKLLNTVGPKYWSLGFFFFFKGGEMTPISTAVNVRTESQDWILKKTQRKLFLNLQYFCKTSSRTELSQQVMRPPTSLLFLRQVNSSWTSFPKIYKMPGISLSEECLLSGKLCCVYTFQVIHIKLFSSLNNEQALLAPPLLKDINLHFALLPWQHDCSLNTDLLETVCLEIQFDFGYSSEKKNLSTP